MENMKENYLKIKIDFKKWNMREMGSFDAG